MRLYLITLTLITLVIAACSGDDDGTPTPSPTPEPTITREQLALMPLSDAELGLAPGSLSVSGDSGYLSSHDLAYDTIDPLDTFSDVESSNWLASYRFGYEDETLAATGATSAWTSLDLFRSSVFARAFIEEQLSDADDLQEKVFFGGAEIVNATEFDISGGDGGFGLKLRVRFGELSANTWMAGFRIGGLVAGVSITRRDGEDITAGMAGLVSLLEQRVRGVIDGTAQLSPFPTATLRPDMPGLGQPPEQGPFPERMALALSELPGGSALEEEGYLPNVETLTYERSFNLGPRGNSGPFGLDVNVELWPSVDDAELNFDTAQFIFLGPGGEDALEESLVSLPFEITNVAVREGAGSNVGDDSFHLIVTYRMAFGNVQNDFAFVRVGNVIGTLIFTGFTEQTDQAYIDSLMQRFVQLIETELQSP